MIRQIARDEFLKDYSKAMQGVFRTFDLKEGVFSNRTFQAVLLPEDVFSTDREIAAFEETVRNAGDRVILFTNVEMLPMHSENLVLSVGEDDICQALADPTTHLGLFSTAVFSESASWGLLIDKRYECKVFGGLRKHVDEFVMRLGGYRKVEAGFASFAKKMWSTWGVEGEEQERILNCYRPNVGNAPKVKH